MQSLAYRPAYKHDCDDCLFLGHWQGLDLYFCPNEPTVIARGGDEGPNYTSGLNCEPPALVEAQERAVRLGFVAQGPATRYVTVYELGREYGGPEEGGWWYDTGTVVLTRRLDPNEDGGTVAEELRKEYPTGSNRFSMVPRGRDYAVEIDEGPGVDYPSETPRYE